MTESGLGGALVIQKELRHDDCNTIFVFNLIVSLILYSLVFITADYIEEFYHIKDLSTVSRVLSLVFVINGICVVPRTILCYNLRFRELCIITLVSAIISSIVSIVMAFFDCGVYTLVVFQLLGAFITAILSLIISKYKPIFHFSRQSFKKLFAFGFYTTITGVLDTLYENLMASVYGKWLSVTSAGYLSQAKKLEEASTQSILSTVNNTSFPILSKMKESIAQFRYEADKILTTIPLIVFPIMFVLYSYSDDVIRILLGTQWTEAAPYLRMLVIAGLFMILDDIVRNFIKSLGLVKKLFYLTIVKRIIGLSLIMLAVIVSTEYILLAYAISAALGFLLTSMMYSKIVGLHSLNIFIKTFKSVIYTAPLFFAIEFTQNYIHNFLLSAVLAVLEMMIYYLIILKILHINIMSYLRRR